MINNLVDFDDRDRKSCRSASSLKMSAFSIPAPSHDAMSPAHPAPVVLAYLLFYTIPLSLVKSIQKQRPILPFSPRSHTPTVSSERSSIYAADGGDRKKRLITAVSYL